MSDKPSVRKGDAAFIQPAQSSRYLEVNNDWFFFTREKDLLGPYRSRRIAEHAVKIYIKKMDSFENGIDTKAVLRGVSDTDDTNVLYFRHPNWNV